MPRNGSGSYGLPAGNPVVPSTVISSTWANTTLSDIGTALTQSIANDGQTTPVANLPMATFRHTNVGNAVARNDYAAAGQVQDSSLQWLTSVAGTNTITASITPSPTAYTAGQTFRFVSAGANTGATTLNINGLGAKNVTKAGAVPLSANDILTGAVYQVVYDGTQFQLGHIPAGTLINTQFFTASGTWTKPAGCNSVFVRVIGGGGGGGGAAATGAATSSIGGGGGAGGYSESFITSGLGATETVTVGAGGTGVSGAAGNSGGNSSFGAHSTGNGGGGGTVSGPSTSSFAARGGAGGSATGGLLNLPGGCGNLGWISDATNGFSGSGGSSALGGGANSNVTNTAGLSASANTGAGGGGANNSFSQGARAGGTGGSGVVIVHSFT